MQKLVIVESPAKAKTIQGYLGKDYVVKSSMGHVRNLADKEFGNNISTKYKPTYEVLADKKKIVAELKKNASSSELVLLATDEDREGEAIAWHLFEVLKLKKDKTRRIAFHEITKDAIQKAIENPRNIDGNLVNAQQARSVLDKIVGFELSPVLWRKVKNKLSAGRVQSVTVKLVVEREREIQRFASVSAYKVVAIFGADGKRFKAELKNSFGTKNEAKEFLNKCINAKFTAENIEVSQGKRSPAPPFTTSTLQQEASRKLGMSVSQTMRVAQSLYESGMITYMRTDSLNLSNLAIASAKKAIVDTYGEKYYRLKKYQTKQKRAQEAHEAIRPTYIANREIAGTAQEKRLYDLIWKRTVASQMTEMLLEKTSITISSSNSKELFVASGETIVFDGFFKLYTESRDEEQDETTQNILPKINKNQILDYEEIVAEQKFSKHPFRYSEASLVKKLEELGIGRPSTYAFTISTIQQRGYVEKREVLEKKPKSEILTLKNDVIKEKVVAEKTVQDKGKLVPTDIGFVVNDFLIENFPEILDYKFTSNIEENFDKIADGKLEWIDEIVDFYKDFRVDVEKATKREGKSTGERLLGSDPKTGSPVIVRISKFGSTLVQIGENSTEKKPIFASLMPGQSLETITLEEALDLFKLPMNIGQHNNTDIIVATGRFGPYMKYGDTNISLPKDKNPLSLTLEEAIELINQPRLPKVLGNHQGDNVVVAKGRFGPYIKNGSVNVSLPRGENPMDITLERAIELIANKNNSKTNAEIKVFEKEGIRILNGRYGAYISYNKSNFKIPKELNPDDITLEQATEIVSGEPAKKRAKFSKK